jgi:hypothetical protein
VDHRSLAAQGILDREPGVHRGPAVSGIEARGEVSAFGERQREQVRAAGVRERTQIIMEYQAMTPPHQSCPMARSVQDQRA